MVVEEQNQNNQQNDNNGVDERLSALEQRLEKAENEKMAMKMELDKANNDLYSDDYVEFLSQKNNPNAGKKDPLADLDEEKLQNLGMKDIVALATQNAIEAIRAEQIKTQTKQQLEQRKQRVAEARKEIAEFGQSHPDMKQYLGRISELADENPRLKLPQLYRLAKAEDEDNTTSKTEPKKETNPDTKPRQEVGINKDEARSKSLREVIAEEYKKTKR
jgi:hypothetical protein